MDPHVIFQLLTMNERIVTLGTLVYFLSSVGLYVSLQVASLCARKVALYSLQITGCCSRKVAV